MGNFDCRGRPTAGLIAAVGSVGGVWPGLSRAVAGEWPDAVVVRLGAAEPTDGDGLSWADVHEGETFGAELRGALGTVDGVPVLGPDRRACAWVGDSRVVPVVRGLAGGGPVVVDVGEWCADAAQTASTLGVRTVCLAVPGTADGARAMRLAWGMAQCPRAGLVVAVMGGQRAWVDAAVGGWGHVVAWRRRGAVRVVAEAMCG